MLIGIPRESKPGETLVAATAKSVTQLTNLGYDVIVESGAGELADQSDQAFTDAGVRIGTSEQVWSADVVVKVNAPTPEEITRLRRGATIISMMAPARSPELLDQLQAAGVTALAMDAVPRISRAQSMDVLSSMANVAGYRAVVEAAHEFGRMFTGQVTAAGKIPPARVFVVGAGVAGLAAIGAASAMGAVVRAFDVRPEVAEQVESMGAQFVHVDFEAEVSTDGYAKEMSAEQVAATAAMYDEEAREADIVITTALIPGRPAPKLITAETIAGMRNGSVIVDMAAANGGNATGTVTDQKIVTDNGVTILGYTDLAGRLAAQTSQLYGTNIVNLLKLITPAKDGVLTLDFDDVVQRGITVVRDGESTWPPPAVQVSAAPAAAPAAAAEPKPEKKPMTAGAKVGLVLAGVALFWLINALAPTDDLRRHFTVLMLSIVIGYYVIGKVAHALHTPLMSVTNAISGVVVVGALVQVASDDLLVIGLSSAAILLASINVFGGFAVTRRMLAMFSKGA
ncbi:Re/Si-specific NAD(P)(+) transhydrogenase subunit alpha [Nocardioides sp. zg-536]|uniref:NAD(P) transhydrogenase subunit alpha n=1 Tax=Nocardioides faecalis TaxID=2803858 RepID=A0A938Y3S8_9ACTN|nr:Re/Si-specific NAD(P)(+) transhydrogenase subunit alpha [Nocardioides faecalis]MBM9458632.1 Re/Si-specific NAD(P)(+) transhydrogenase subunit alpha [Nocardioides faecalis]MBS4752964.1 Re/Si-specific NAD(P)(+) transhydrogenase subunit alpha [Nocardioides faecalis]QVI58629.1 Re/Si-specific NAD(P)(+) transhydrogenase subunit alpha [Nocardioides faecalis]